MMTVGEFVEYCKSMENKFGIKVPAGTDPHFLKYIVDRMTSLTESAQVVRPTKCPHCEKGIHTVGSVLEAINFACGGGTPANPEMVIGGYHLWFRGYMVSPNMIDLFGICVAFPPQPLFDKGNVAYCVMPVHDGFDLTVQAMKRGDAIDVEYRPGWISESVLELPDALDILVAAKKRAMQFLKEHIENLPVLDSPQPKEENTIGKTTRKD